MTPNAYPSPSLSLSTLPDVGARFQSLRKAAGKTQTEVAAAVGMRQEALSRFESGRGTDFSLSKFLRLLEALDLELDFKPTMRRPQLSAVLDEVRAGANTGPTAR